jgi:hypothetical protein
MGGVKPLGIVEILNPNAASQEGEFRLPPAVIVESFWSRVCNVV